MQLRICDTHLCSGLHGALRRASKRGCCAVGSLCPCLLSRAAHNNTIVTMHLRNGFYEALCRASKPGC